MKKKQCTKCIRKVEEQANRAQAALCEELLQNKTAKKLALAFVAYDLEAELSLATADQLAQIWNQVIKIA